MSQQAQGLDALSYGDVVEKRKRGRSTKDSIQVENKPAAESSKKKGKTSAASARCANQNGAIGQVVTGVIDGSFDAGYLLTVRVGDSNTVLRGVGFIPGRYDPINICNDVAPRLVTYKRKRFNRSKLNTKPSGPVKPKEQASTSGKSQPSNPQLGTSKVFLPKNEPDLTPNGKAISAQVELGVEGQSTGIMAQLESAEVVDHDKGSQGIEASKLMKGPNKVELNEESNVELLVNLLPDVEASSNLTEGKTEVEENENSNVKLNAEPDSVMSSCIEAFIPVGAKSSEQSTDLVLDQMETRYPELNEPPLVSELELMDSDPNSQLIDSLLEKKGKGDTELAVQVPHAEDTNSEMVHEGEAVVVPFGPEAASEGDAPPGETKHPMEASRDIVAMDCDA